MGAGVLAGAEVVPVPRRAIAGLAAEVGFWIDRSRRDAVAKPRVRRLLGPASGSGTLTADSTSRSKVWAVAASGSASNSKTSGTRSAKNPVVLAEQ
jgi:hypothetical protein